MARRTPPIVATLLCAFLALSARAGETVQVRGGEHDEGFARIAVEWASPVGFEANLDGETLTIHFARSFTAQLSPLAGQLQHYVATVGQSADGTSIIVKLKKPIEIRASTVNGTIASIDLVARKALERKAPEQKVAERSTPEKKVTAANSQMKKDEARTPGPMQAEAQVAEAAKAAAAEALANAVSPAVGAPVNLLPPVAVAGKLDTAPSVTPPPATAPPTPPKPPARSTRENVQVRGSEHHEGYARIAVEWPKPVTYDAKLNGDTLTVHFGRAFAAPLAPLADELKHYVASVEQSADGTSLIAKLTRTVTIKTATVNGTIASVDLIARQAATAEKPAEKTSPAQTAEPKTAARQPEKKADARKAEKVEATKPEPKPAELASALPVVVPPALAAPANLLAAPAPSAPVPSAAPDAAPAASPVSSTESASASGVDIKLTPALALDNDRASLRFDWPMPVGAAVYRRSGATWVVFGAPSTLDLTTARTRGQPVLQAIDAVRAEGATAVRIVTADGTNPSLRRAGNAWIIDLRRQDAKPDAPIVVDAWPAPAMPAVVLHVRDAGAPVRLRDPLLGDSLTIVPVGEIGRGIDVTHNFVDFRLLPSVQGIVIRPNADDLDVHNEADLVRITRPQGLTLSDEHDRLLGRTVANAHRIFDFAAWRGPAKASFADRRSALERAIAAAAPGARTRPRLDLARFYFANLFGAETLAVLAQIARDDPKAASDTNLRAMKGAACLLAGIDDCATQELGQKGLDDEPEATVWRGSLAAGKGDWPTAAREFSRGIGLVSSYPPRLRNRFALEAAETMLESDRGSGAGPLIDAVLKDPDPGEQAMATYLKGRVAQEGGQLERALELWDQAAATNDRKARARALYAKAMALYEAKKASRADTIKTLDALRFSWRGDNFEFALLQRLADLKLAEHDLEGGLDAMHLASAYFPDYPAAKDVTKKAADTFADLFLGKADDDVPPVKTLALYDAFSDLIPNGERHDAIVKKLIDRLVSVDLLDRAAGLLEEQVKTRLAGLDKTRSATQLALLRLMNHQPDAALTALDIDVGASLTPDLTRQRQELRARAMLDLNRAPEALALLGDDNSRDAYRLRADIYWRQHDWKNAAKTFALLAGQPPAQGPLDAETARVVLSWAAALTIDGDQAGVAKLRQDFGPAMAGAQTADAFNIITGDASLAASGGGTPNEIAARVAQIGTLQNFMAAYKQRLANDKLSAIN